LTDALTQSRRSKSIDKKTDKCKKIAHFYELAPSIHEMVEFIHERGVLILNATTRRRKDATIARHSALDAESSLTMTERAAKPLKGQILTSSLKKISNKLDISKIVRTFA
jgi:hypothetical protein